jgi:predicted transcriptional regulator
MHREAGGSQASGASRLQRAVVLELLDAHGEQGLELTQLADALGVGPSELAAAVETLRLAGVVLVRAGLASASAAARCLDELELIAV